MAMQAVTEAPHTYTCAQGVHELVEEQARRTPEAVALVAGDQTLTYSALNARANQLAHHLRRLGVGPKTLVGICMERSPELVVGLLGILKAGGAYVPLDPAYPRERIAFMCDDAQLAVLLAREHTAAALPIRAGQQVICLDSESVALAQESSENPPGGTAPANLAYVIYTSGSTGRPKGVQITHESMLNLVRWHRRAFDVAPGDRASQMASPAFDAAAWELWPYLTAGASVYLPNEEIRAMAGPLRDWLVAQGITISFLPAPLAEAVMALEWPTQTALRVLLTGADTLHCYPSSSLPFSVVNNYGPTETTVVATSGPVPSADCPAGLPAIGRPIANTQVYILDDALQPVPFGATGELYIGGAGVARGYLNRPDLTAERFIPDPFSAAPGARLYRTGDMARYRQDGQIAFMGRRDDQVKIRGYRVEPGEIIAALNEHPGVEASVVIAHEAPSGDKRLVAYVVPAPGASPSTTALRDYLGTRLPDYMVPSSFFWLEALPLTPNGKVDRAALPAPDAENAPDEGFEAPSTLLEERLSAMVAALLGLQRVGLHDNFFLLGGHSLLGAQLIAQVRDTFGIELSLHSLFEAPTVAGLAATIEQRILAALDAMSDEDAQRLLA